MLSGGEDVRRFLQEEMPFCRTMIYGDGDFGDSGDFRCPSYGEGTFKELKQADEVSAITLPRTSVSVVPRRSLVVLAFGDRGVETAHIRTFSDIIPAANREHSIYS
jgi:hypothetical protein